MAIFAAFSFYTLIDSLPAFAFLALVTLLAGGLALRYESRAIAILGIVGGFLTPVLLEERLPDQRLLLAYVLLLDLGVLALATFRNWRWFTLLALLGSLANFGLWAAKFDPRDNLLLGQLAITLIFLMFVAATTMFHILWRRRPGIVDLSLMLFNAAAYLGISYALLWNDFRPWLGGFTLLLALLYGLLAYAALIRIGEQVRLSFMALGIGLVLLTIAVPVQFEGPWISVAWAAEAAALTWLSFNLGMWQLRAFSLGVFVALVLRLLESDTLVDLEGFRFVLNGRMLAFSTGIAAIYAAAFFVSQNRDRLKDNEEHLFSAFLLSANFLTLWVLSAELIAVVDSGIVTVTGRAADHAKSLGLDVLWALYASLAIVLGIFKRWWAVRLGGLALLALPVIKLFAVDVFTLTEGFRVAAFLALGAILVAGGFLYQRYSSVIRRIVLEDPKPSPGD